VDLVLLTRVGEVRQQQFNALHDQIDVGFPRIGGGVMAMFSESFLVRVADERKLLGAPTSVSACASLSLVCAWVILFF
jgi:hypothetical protein